MNRRDFPGHAAWTETHLNGDHVLAFIAIKPHHLDIEPHLHQVYDRTHFKRRTDAVLAARDALSKLLHIDEDGCPVFSSPEC
ncbi:hypothetical protein E8E95_10000 [Pseudomonas sp. BN414]|uniref:hypothetical protein n=1 Tax=Pseudomonadaceae TaxID=135621 RepID=UPI000984C39A|nr:MULTISPECIES: hypothetical protein [Pseudomonas]MDH4567010.1 hypothetical protein [Pseudomonas sp. BN414]GLZ86336.1 hypothetical protein Pres01_23870 [Pseudomonas resinovorans]